MEQNKDQASGRHLIEGKGIPVDGGVFRRTNHPGIVVDSSKLEDIGWFKGAKEVVLSINQGLLNMATFYAKQYVRVDENFYKNVFVASFGKTDRFSLSSFVLRDDVDKQTKGTADSQALLAALLIETRLNNEKKDERRVAIVRDPGDGHARVFYQGKHNDIYRFDPTKGDEKFVKLEDK